MAESIAPHCTTPRIRPLVHTAGHPQTRRPARHPHPVAPAMPAEPRTPRHPRGECAPAHGGGQGDIAIRFAHRLVEVLTGTRPVGQLQRHTTLQGYQQLSSLVRTGPLRPRGLAPRARLGRVYDTAPVPGALEVCVRVELGHRHHMVAFRLEQHRRTDQWQCAAIEAR